MAKLSTDDLLDAFKEMTLLELSEFVKKFEETFEVTAAAPVAVAAAGGGGGAAAAEEVEEQDEFDVMLDADRREEDPGDQGGAQLTSLGLKEAKDLVEAAPKAVLEKVNKESRRQGQGGPRGRRRHGHAQVAASLARADVRARRRAAGTLRCRPPCGVLSGSIPDDRRRPGGSR